MMDRLRGATRRTGTETVEFIISFWAFLGFFVLLLVVILVFINALAAQRGLNELATFVGATGSFNDEVRIACQENFRPVLGGTTPVSCRAFTENVASIPSTEACIAGAPIQVTIQYGQQFLPGTLAALFGVKPEVVLTRSMWVTSQSSRGRAACA